MKRRYRLSDSRLKRSQNGRATAWEIKMVLGIPSTIQLPPGRYSGTVTPSGDVTVIDKRTGKAAGSMTNAQLVALEQQELQNKTGMKVGVGYSSVGVNNSYAPKAPIAGYAAFQSQMKGGVNQGIPPTLRNFVRNNGLIEGSILKLNNVIGSVGAVIGSLVSISKGMEAIGKSTEGAKDGVNTLKEAMKGIREGAAKLSASGKILEKLKKMRSKVNS